eukprot:4808109-Pyramimonas_sp.AAC.2
MGEWAIFDPVRTVKHIEVRGTGTSRAMYPSLAGVEEAVDLPLNILASSSFLLYVDKVLDGLLLGCLPLLVGLLVGLPVGLSVGVGANLLDVCGGAVSGLERACEIGKQQLQS